MRLTEKSQVTVPKHIRERLGIGPGSEVEFVEREGVVILESRDHDIPEDPVARRQWFEAHFARMHGTIDTMGMDGKEYVDWLRGPREDLDPS